MFNSLFSRIFDTKAHSKVAEPDIGSVVYCDLVTGIAEHSGIYVGDNTIIHLTKYGFVERCTPSKFMEDTTARNIYVSCYNGHPSGSVEAAYRAKALADARDWRKYNVILNNCHMFSEYCLTGKENTTTFLTLLKYTCEKTLPANTWHIWDLAEYAKTREARNRAELQAALLKAEQRLRVCIALRGTLNAELDIVSKQMGQGRPGFDFVEDFEEFCRLDAIYKNQSSIWDMHQRHLLELADLIRSLQESNDADVSLAEAKITELTHALE